MEELLLLKTLIVALVFVVLFIGERVYRAAKPPASKARLARNGGLWLVTFTATPFIIAPLTALGANHMFWQRGDVFNSGWVGVGVLIVDLIILDCWTYWLHRAYHCFPLMWRLHEVHHRDEFLDTTSAVRFHIGEVLLSAGLRLVPITLLATPLKTVVVFEILLLCIAIFHHSNIHLPRTFESVLSKMIVTPSIHWVHHHAIQKDTDSNYAAVLSLWDRLFRSKSATERIPGLKIGAEGVEDLPFFALLLSPVMRKCK